jgi:GMP synthase-like glutamine amidotransferase
MAIIVLQHSPSDPPARLGATLRDHGFKLDVRRLDLVGAAGVPVDFDNVHGVISMGGEQNVGEDHAWMTPELDYLRKAHALQIPVIGICLGAQMIAAALGGKVGPLGDGSKKTVEWGFTKVSLGTFGQLDTVLAGIAWDSYQFEAHGQEVKQLPPDSTVLASSAACKVQAFRAGLRTYGFQYHFECDRAMIDEFTGRSAASLAAAGLTAGDIAAQADRHYEMFGRLSERLCVNLATYLFPLMRKMSA